MSRPSRRCEPVPLEIRETASLLERRWQLSILYAALAGALRFNEFADAVAGISPRMLSERLRGPRGPGAAARPRGRRAGAAHRDPVEPPDGGVPPDRTRTAPRAADRRDARVRARGLL